VTHLVKFWREFLATPQSIGSVAPSSRYLAQRMVEWVDWDEARAVIECGPGTGPCTERILQRIRKDATFFAVELSPKFAAVFRERFPEAVLFEDCVRNLPDLCGQMEVEAVDCILTGLPWAAFSLPTQREFLDAMTAVLKPGGQFVTFAYLQGMVLPPGRRFRRLLSSYFSEVSCSKVVWANVPPAIVYRCRR